jgi:hypothetical protein
VLVTRLGWLNGSTLTTSNFDIGIYTSAWARVVSAGSTARSGASVWQWVDVADTSIGPGDYYLVGAADTTGASRVGGLTLPTAPTGAGIGLKDSATDAFPLPNPLTNMAAAAVFTTLPWLAIEVSSVAPTPPSVGSLPPIWVPDSLYENQAGGLESTGTFPTALAANQAMYCPVTFPCDATIYNVSFVATNGTGNYDLGLYDASYRRLASTGSTAMSAAGVKTLTFPDIRVKAGTTLYVGVVWSSISARMICQANTTVVIMTALGIAEEASALPLPATATPVMVAAATRIPLFTFGIR